MLGDSSDALARLPLKDSAVDVEGANTVGDNNVEVTTDNEEHMSVVQETENQSTVVEDNANDHVINDDVTTSPDVVANDDANTRVEEPQQTQELQPQQQEPLLPPPAPPAQRAGPRVQQLNKIFHYALDKCLDSCGETQFASAFPDVAASHPQLLEEARRDVVEHIRTTMTRRFVEINHDRSIPHKLNLLDSLVLRATQNAPNKRVATADNLDDEATLRKATSIRRVPPEELARAYRMDAKRAEMEMLRQSLHDIEDIRSQQFEQFHELQDTAAELRTEIENARNRIVPHQDILAKLEAIARPV